MFRLQNVPVGNQAHYILSSLEGDARRPVLILPEEKQWTADQIFVELSLLYGDKVYAPDLRSMFFNCRQESSEGSCEFAFRLQELFNCLKKRDDRGIADEDLLLRDQFVNGLYDSKLRGELCIKVLTNNNLNR